MLAAKSVSMCVEGFHQLMVVVLTSSSSSNNIIGVTPSPVPNGDSLVIQQSELKYLFYSLHIIE